MPASHRLASLALAVACLAPAVLAPASANAMDDFVRAIGSGPTQLSLCGDGDGLLKPAACKAGGVDTLPPQIHKAVAAAPAQTPVHGKALLKRDHGWVGGNGANAADSMSHSRNA